ncbi:MAG: MBL fold metallo-hydrolase [Burkholderiaceae bacterium]|nr:MBL fold metallo-hydrolase [Burkholderiaceae bacterium]
MQIETFFDPATSSFSYLIFDAETRHCALLDTVLDFDSSSGRTGTANADRLISRVRELGARVQWLLETHVHADHLSASAYLKRELGGQSAIGAKVTTVQETFASLFNAGAGFARDGSQFDRLFDDGDSFLIGGIRVRAMHTPGHTPACLTYVLEDASERVAFVGDTLFMPGYGTARCDFPGGDATALYRSIRKILSLPPDTLLYMCHDYPPEGKPPQQVNTVAQQRASNVHVKDGVDEAEFVAMRTARDATLDVPALILPAVQVNMRAGRFPPAESNGTSYLKIPLDAF